MKVRDVCSISGGKDSTATACLALDRAEKTGRDPLFVFADTGNEHEITLRHVDYLERAFGHKIERVKADFSERLEQRRRSLPTEWGKEKTRIVHNLECKTRRATLSPAEVARLCKCPVKTLSAVPDDLIERAVQIMQPTGNPFLDLCLLKGRFPSRRAQFCTEELKVVPINELVHPLLNEGVNVVSWLGERAEESQERAAKKPIQSVRFRSGARLVYFRPIHKKTSAEVFAIANRRGIKPNPLYLQGMSRVGCMPCINCKKSEVAAIARRFPDHIDKIRLWENLLRAAARRGASTFFAADRFPEIPGEDYRPDRASIDNVVEWSKTDRGGRQFDALARIEAEKAAEEGAMCESAYGLCE